MSLPVESRALRQEEAVNCTPTLLPPGSGTSLHLGRLEERLRATGRMQPVRSPPVRRRTPRRHVRWVSNDEREHYDIPRIADALSDVSPLIFTEVIYGCRYTHTHARSDN